LQECTEARGKMKMKENESEREKIERSEREKR
jgi:hypothetical protein